MSLTFAAMLFAACGEKPQQFWLSNGTLVQVYPRGDHRYEVVDFDKLTHDERTEFYFLLPSDCVIKHTTVVEYGMFGFSITKDIVGCDRNVPNLLQPV